MWKNKVEPDRAHMTMGRTRNACWITRATDTHPICLFTATRIQNLANLTAQNNGI